MAQKVAQSLEAKVYIHRKVGYISQKRGHAKKRDQLRKTRLKRAQQFNQHRNLNVRRNRANRHRLSKQTLTPRVAIHRPANIEVRNISSQRDTQSEQNSIDIWIDPGNAKKTELAELYSALSELYRAHGGIGIDFRDEGTKIYSVDKSSS